MENEFLINGLVLVLRFYLSKVREMLVVHEFRVTGSRLFLAYFKVGLDLFGPNLAGLGPIWACFGLF